MLPRFFQDLIEFNSIYSNLIEISIYYILIFLIIYFFSLKNESFTTKIINIILNIYFITMFLYINEFNQNILNSIFYLFFTICIFHIITKITLNIIKIIYIIIEKITKSTPKQSVILPHLTSTNKRSSPFGSPQVMTSFGLKVRSKSEVFIAEKLYENKIEFKYETPLTADGKTYYPDFTIYFGKNAIYWEHFGMLSDETYAQKTDLKIKWYQKNFPNKLIWTQEDPNLMPYIHDIVINLAKFKQRPPNLHRLLKKTNLIKGYASQIRRT